MTRGKLPNPSQPQVPSLQHGDDYGTYLMGLQKAITITVIIMQKTKPLDPWL